MQNKININVPETEKEQERIIIVGAGFGGLRLARKIVKNGKFQVLIIDRNNYHQFQPLLYQVATAGLEPSSISFPIRKIFKGKKNVFIRIAGIEEIEPEKNTIVTSEGDFTYDKLVIATGTTTNFFGNDVIRENSIGLKSISEALSVRNQLLKNYEKALVSDDEVFREAAMNIAIVGGGPTGVELAGAIAELRNNILPREYHALDFSNMNIFLIEAADRLLGAMSDSSSKKAYRYLTKMGVKILLNTRVDSCEGNRVITSAGDIISSNIVWAAGMKGTVINGLPDEIISPSGRILVDEFNHVKGFENIYAIGDISLMKTEKYPKGHPQVAPVAIQQAKNLAKNISATKSGKKLHSFRYFDKGTMATVGRNLAVVELPFVKFGGFFAWITWMFVHLMSILGIKNRFFIFVNWLTNYFTYDLSLRLIISAKEPVKTPELSEVM